MIEIRLIVHRIWTEHFEDLDGRLRLHNERAELLKALLEAIGVEVRDWGETFAPYPREKVTVDVDAGSIDKVEAVVEGTAEWLRNGRVLDVEIGIAGRDPVSLRRVQPRQLLEPFMASANGGRGGGHEPAAAPVTAGVEPDWAAAPPRSARPRGALAAPAMMGNGDEPQAAMAEAEPPEAARHVAYGLLRGPAEVVALEEFVLEVGLSQAPAAGVAGPPLALPPVAIEPYIVDVRIAAPGFTFPRRELQRRQLAVSAADPFPVVNVRLVPKHPQADTLDRTITAEYSINGERLGDAIRSIRVLRASDLRSRPAADRVEAGVNVLAPTGEEVADLTVTVRTSDRQGWVDWSFESPHADVVTPNVVPLSSNIGDAAAYIRNQVQQIDAAEGAGGVFNDVLALAHRVAQSMPSDVWKAMRAVATKKGAPPTILLVTQEAHVPWELAKVDPPLVAGSGLPPFLAAQARIGRWVQAVAEIDGRTRPSPNPPRRKDVASLGVVWGSYAKTSWSSLTHAAKEARELMKVYGAEAIKPTNKAMYDLLRGVPPADLLHFAVHGRYNPQNPGAESGIILTDGNSLHANEIAARELASKPVVFLNACQLAAGQLELGAYSGVAAAFVEAGASAVVAPLWKVDDEIARTIALTFYERAARGDTLSEILRSAREAFVDAYETTSATWMAYQLFGHPSFVVGGLRTA